MFSIELIDSFESILYQKNIFREQVADEITAMPSNSM